MYGCIPPWEGKKYNLQKQFKFLLTDLEKKNQAENVAQKFGTVRPFMDLKRRGFKKFHPILKNQLLLE